MTIKLRHNNPLHLQQSIPPTKTQRLSLQSHMVTERIPFKVILDKTISEIDVRTKALVIFGKLTNIDPSRIVMPYHDSNLSDFLILATNHYIPASINKMSKYIFALMYNPKNNKLQFHSCFWTVTSNLQMKRDQTFMSWLKDNKIYTLVMTLSSTENTCIGFFR